MRWGSRSPRSSPSPTPFGWWHAEWSTFSSDLLTDLDLVVKGPSGQHITGSYSARNSFEVVGFTAPVSGYYKFRVKNDSFGSSSESYGTAVSLD